VVQDAILLMWSYQNINENPSADYIFQLPYKFSCKLDGPTRREHPDFAAYRDEVRGWCEERYGIAGCDNIAKYRYTFWDGSGASITVLFRDEPDAVEFRIRWC
jgi:hypothetical protein